MITRRWLAKGLASVCGSLPFASCAFGDTALLMLPRDAVQDAPTARIDKLRVKVSLAGWLVCNGALALRDVYRELFEVIGERFGAGDGRTSFSLPSYAVEFRLGQPYKGVAINPRTTVQAPAGVIMPFVIDPGT
jgi:hypothetical protein